MTAKSAITSFILLISTFQLFAQKDTVKFKSYLYWGQPNIEDNSMFIEEAFNQERGVIQHISNLIYDDKNWVYAYTQEIPLDDYRHQLSFTIPYTWLDSEVEFPIGGSNQFLNSGLGDILINYRPLLWGKNDWALVIPRFTLILPTGNAQYGLGSGAWGGQFNLAVTKRVAKSFTTHWNAGFTQFQKADYFEYDNTAGTFTRKFEKDLSMYNLGLSVIWSATDKLNFLVEYVDNFEKEILETGSLDNNRITIINPGFRAAFQIGKVQIVPGLGVPLNFENGNYTKPGLFFYLSIEPNYTVD